MAAIAEESSEQRYGSLVAVEGESQTITTQLRLLPPSSKILILNSLLDDIKKQAEDTTYNPRAFVRDVHAAYNARAETARSFLQSSTLEQPRLVFLNGGSVCAKTACITSICENITNGEIREAEALFAEIVKDGVAGLLKPDEPAEETANENTSEDEDMKENEEEKQDEESQRSHSDAGSAAMKAADDLDRDTAELQPSNDVEVEDDAMIDAAHQEEQAVTGSAPQEEAREPKEEAREVIPTVEEPASEEPIHSKNSENETGEVFTTETGDVIRETIISLPAGKRVVREDGSSGAVSHRDSTETGTEDVLSPGTDYQHSQPVTPGVGGVEYGEACIVDVQSATLGKPVRQRVRSMDRMFNRTSKLPQPSPATASHPGMKHSTSYQEFRRGRISSDDDENERTGSRGSLESLPRATFVRGSVTTIRRSPTLKMASLATAAPKVYIDRGTDAEKDEETGESTDAPFEPVFPIIEDLVIHFSNANSNEIFDSVIRAYKDGSYPVFPPRPVSEPAESTPTRPSTAEEAQANEARPFSHMTAETDDDGYHRRQEIDPYNPDSYPSGQRLWPQPRQPKNFTHIQSIAEPPTPATTPPPIMSEIGRKFHEFSPVNSNSAVGIQNSLRSVLNIHFGPAETTKYRQYQIPMDCDRLWKPVFRNDDGQGNEGRTVDQILAIGCEDGVSKDFFTEISGQVEKLGTKKSGQSRVGKIDIRYLIANAMQSHTALPLAVQSTSNPFGNPLSLATALIPHIETYLSINTSTRLLLLTYPASHLSTVISLRKLLGSDLLKVTGIIDALASDPPNFSARSSPPPPLNLLSNEGAASLNQRFKPTMSISSFARTRAEFARQASAAHSYSISSASSKRDSSNTDPSFSFARANFLLPSTATDAEIASFLSGIWKTLIEKSEWYAPEQPSPTPSIPATPNAIVSTTLPVPPPIPPTPQNQTAENAPRSPMAAASHSASASHRSKKSIGKASKIDQLLGNTSSSRGNSVSGPAPSSDAARLGSAGGYAPSTKTVETSYSEKERRDDKAWENFDLGGESDDEIDRMLMPRLPKKTERKKGNSRKALKWLGLA